jgi:hypothetical protein
MATALASGCGSSGSGGPGPDSGTGTDSSTSGGDAEPEAASPDATSDGPVESAVVDAGHDAASMSEGGATGDGGDGGDGAAPLAAGSLLVPGSTLTVHVVTGDGFVAYLDDSSGVASAVSLSSHTVQSIATGTAGHTQIGRLDSVVADVNTLSSAGVVVFTDTLVPDGGSPDVPFTTWSSTGGAQNGWGPGLVSLTVQGSNDGSRVSWVNRSGTTGTLEVSSSTPGQPYTVASGLTVPYAVTAFGGTAGTDLIVELSTGVLEAFDTANGTVAKTISSQAATPPQLGNFVLDASQTRVAYLDANSNMWLAAAPAYTPQQVSALGNLQAFPLFSPDGSTLFFNDANGVIYRSPVTTPAAVTVAPGAPGGVYSVSPDGQWLLASANSASSPFIANDVQIVSSLATNGTLVAVDANPNAFETDFTADSTHVYEAINATSVTGESGGFPNAPQVTLVGYDIATRTTTASISSSVLWSPVAATGSLLVFYDNPRTTSTPGHLLCDLRDVDLSAASPTSKLLQADVQCGGRSGFALEPIVPTLTADRRAVVYAYQGTAFQPGIYAYTLP